jgi:hypothetical protein
VTTLRHLSVESRHVRDSQRDEVADKVLAALAPSLRRALEGETVALAPSAWTLTATAEEGGERLDAQLWYGPAEAEPHVRMTVDREAMTLTTTMGGIASLPPYAASQAASEAGGLERCIAWAWLEGRTPRDS